MTNAYEISTEGSRTEIVAKALFNASRQHNDGMTVDDALFYDSLPDTEKHHLLDVAAAVEVMMTEFPDEGGRLLIWNVAILAFDAYHLHEYSSNPHFPFELAPSDVKKLWYKYADAMVTAFYEAKHNPSSGHFTNLKIRLKA